MRLERLYAVTFTTPEAWSVEVAADAGIEGRAFLFEWQGLAVLTDSGMRRLLGSLVHLTDDPRYLWLNDRVCAVEGEVRPRTDGSGCEVGFEVSEMVWEGLE